MSHRFDGRSELVLCVDDEQRVLDGLSRFVPASYDVLTCRDPQEAIEVLANADGRIAVVISDLRMPGMDGITLLHEAATIAPTVVRVLLTGFADVEGATAAINKGKIFRFLTKPAKRDELIAALDDSMVQHRLIVAEKQLLEQTLRGSVKALVDALSLANPQAFARADRISRTVLDLADAVGARTWTVEVSAMVSQIGSVIVPGPLIDKLDAGVELDADERELLDAVPAATEQLLANIPRLEDVREIVRYQLRDFAAPPRSIEHEGPVGADLPLGARLLHLAVDVDELEARGLEGSDLAIELRLRSDRYDPELIDVLLEQRGAILPRVVREVDVGELRPGMLVEKDIIDINGTMLLGRGHEITPNLLGVLVKHHLRGRIKDKVIASEQQ